jgi:serine/threonine-protein phosphatase 2B catalytic subunit
MPAMTKPTNEQLFPTGDKPDIAFLKNHFYREGRLFEEQALWILRRGTELLRCEPNVLSVDAPITGESTRLYVLWQHIPTDRPP